MRIRTAIAAIALGVVVAFASQAYARDRDSSSSKSRSKDKTSREVRTTSDAQWDRGDWTERDATSRSAKRSDRTAVRTDTYGTYGFQGEDATTHRSRGQGTATRQFSGPYRYFYTDHEGKYNYFMDRYGYPHAYGGREVQLPVGVLGDVPPEYIGGGPVRYYRNEAPLSRSVFDR